MFADNDTFIEREVAVPLQKQQLHTAPQDYYMIC